MNLIAFFPDMCTLTSGEELNMDVEAPTFYLHVVNVKIQLGVTKTLKASVPIINFLLCFSFLMIILTFYSYFAK